MHYARTLFTHTQYCAISRERIYELPTSGLTLEYYNLVGFTSLRGCQDVGEGQDQSEEISGDGAEKICQQQ